MNSDSIFDKALRLIPISKEEGVSLYKNSSTEELMFIANKLRQLHNPGNITGWMIDRNVNLTNICFSQCSFCNFCRKKGAPDPM